MPQDAKIIRVFIASPGGLDAERQVVRDAVGFVSRSLAPRLGFRLEAVGWETIPRGVGRAQDHINRQLDTCDLIVGLLWDRWGSAPSANGAYTSGFQEEFERALERRKATNSPEVAMFFKTLDPRELQNPGAATVPVLQFKDRLIQGYEIFFDEFCSPTELLLKVQDFLNNQLFELRQPESPDGTQQIQQSETPPDDQQTISHQSRVNAAEFLSYLTSEVRAGKDVPPLDVARVRLFAADRAHSSNDDHGVGVHDGNLIYASRAELALDAGEHWTLAVCGLSHLRQESVPLWSWMARLRDPSVFLQLYSISGSENERLGAFEALRAMRISLSDDGKLSRDRLHRLWFEKAVSEKLKSAALRYLRDCGTVADVSVLESLLAGQSQDVSTSALEALIGIEFRYDKQMAARRLLAGASEKVSVSQAVLSAYAELPNDELVSGLAHPSATLRCQALTTLVARGAIKVEHLEAALGDASSKVRLAALTGLDRLKKSRSLDEAYTILRKAISQGGLFALSGYGPLATSDPLGERYFRAYRRQRLPTMPRERLEEFVLTDSPHREDAWLTLLGRRYETEGVLLKTHIAEGFKSYIAERWPNGVPSRPSTATLGSFPHSKNQIPKWFVC